MLQPIVNLFILTRSFWAVCYSALSLTTLIVTGITIAGKATPWRWPNIVLFLLSNQLAEMPLLVMGMDALCVLWLSFTGTFRQSAMARFFYYVNIITAIGLLYLIKTWFDARQKLQEFLDLQAKESKVRVELPGPSSPRFWSQFMNPFYGPKDATTYTDIPYWTPEEHTEANRNGPGVQSAQMVLDVYRPNSVTKAGYRPVLIYIHGGGWTGGSKSFTGPLVTEMVNREWIVVSVEYRTNSNLGFPVQFLDCKRALRWTKSEIATYGGNPQNIVIGGDSVGGHMAAMMAFTVNDPKYQPGFESVDTTFQGCLVGSAPIDLTNMNGYAYYDTRKYFLEKVAKRIPASTSQDGAGKGKEKEKDWLTAENLKFLTDHSPLLRISNREFMQHPIPFLVLHGDLDTLCPIEGARDFVAEFKRAVSTTTRGKQEELMAFLEVPGGHHVFYLFSSPRTWYTTLTIATWLQNKFDQEQDREKAKRAAREIVDVVEWGWENQE